ncbi:hypothetical protein HY230_06340 [Candidatus Acetothermia bacterium]|nr:hypothetical protein [Candidatus Acetothermia bacterium]
MQRWVGGGVAFLLVVFYCGMAFGIVELGLGVMAPGGAGTSLGRVVLVPHAAIDLAVLGVGADLWFSPGNDAFVLLPYLQLQIPLVLLKVYGTLGPIFTGASGKISLVPPFLGVAAKVGVTITPFSFLGVYGEMVLGISPALMSVSSTSLVAGVRLGF